MKNKRIFIKNLRKVNQILTTTRENLRIITMAL